MDDSKTLYNMYLLIINCTIDTRCSYIYICFLALFSVLFCVSMVVVYSMCH
jgi:hypothetical protein